MQQQDLTEITKEYYNSHDADEFYHTIWGGEDIHIGIYDEGDIIRDASRKTVVRMAEELPNLHKSAKILDIGAGYGGAARFLAKKYGCRVDCLNLSKTENQRNIEKNEAAGLSDQINVIEGNFESLPFADESYHIIWSQDAILHSNQKQKVFSEVFRVLKPGGSFIFTDPMQADECPEGVLQPVLDRIHLEEMGSVAQYRGMAEALGMKEMKVLEMPEQVKNHYGSVLEGIKEHYAEITKRASKDYIDRMMKGLQHWISASGQGYLNWGILHFKKQ